MQPNETIVYSYYTAADVQNGVAGAYVGAEKSVTDNLITPANGDPRSGYTNTTTFQYDSNGNVIQKSGPSGTINYMYDLATQRHTETWTGTDYADAETDIAYGYNLLGELASVTVLKENGATPAAVAASTQYNATGGTSTTTLPNTVYTYDAGGRLTSSFDSATGITTAYSYKTDTNYIQSVTSATSASSVVSSDSYTYRADGLKTGATEYSLNANGTSDTITLVWNYDALDRLISETSSDTAGVAALNYTQSFQYDLNGNRTLETITGNGAGTITSSYNHDDELTQTVDANNGTTTYTYDANGSQSGVTSPTGTTTNVYDLQGRLASVVNKSTSGTVTSSATYYYDDAGNPDPSVSPAEIGTGLLEETTVTGTNSPVTTYFLIDTETATGYAQTIERSQTPGTPTVTYVWGLNLISQNNAAGTPNAGTYYFVVDGHGSTVALLDANGNVVQTFHYDGFGNALGFTISSAITPYLYTQQYYDQFSSTYYDWARNYNPSTGEFTQADYGYSGSLSNPMTDLPYTFTGGDPINMLDPSGHFGIVSVVVDFSLSLAVDVRDIAVATYVRAKEIDAVEALGVLADGLTTGYENVFFGPPSLSATTAFSIGFGAGVVQGLVALDSPAAAAGLGTAIVDVGNEAFSNSHNKFSWPFFARLAADEVFTFGATAIMANKFQELTEAEKFFLSFDVPQAYDLAPGIYEFFKSWTK